MNHLISIDNQVIDCANIKNIEPIDYGRGAKIEFHTLDRLDHSIKTDTDTHNSFNRIDPVSIKKGLFRKKLIVHDPIFNQTSSRQTQNSKGTTKYNYEQTVISVTYFQVCDKCKVDVPNKPQMIKEWLTNAAGESVFYGLPNTQFGIGTDCKRIVESLKDKRFFNGNERMEIMRDFGANEWVFILNDKKLMLTDHYQMQFEDVFKKIRNFIADDLLEREKAKPTISKGFEDCLIDRS